MFKWEKTESKTSPSTQLEKTTTLMHLVDLRTSSEKTTL